MKITKSQLNKIIREETQAVMDEGFFGKMGHKMGFETGETERIDRVLMQVARALEEATGEYGLDLTYEDDPVQAVSDFVDRIGGMFMKAGLPKADMAKAKELMMQGKGQEGADIMYNHFLSMRRTPKGDEARTIISQKLRDIGSVIEDAEDVLRTRAASARDSARSAEFEKEQAAADKSSWWGNRKRKADGPRWTGDRKEKTPHGRATSAVGSSNLAYGEGKLTKSQLNKIIKEVLNEISGEDPAYAGGAWGEKDREKVRQDNKRVGARQKAHDERVAAQKAWRTEADRIARELGWPARARWSADGNDPNNPGYVGYWIQDNDTQEHIQNVESPEKPLHLSAPTEDPWKFKKRLGIGGSVHDRLGGPRHKEKK